MNIVKAVILTASCAALLAGQDRAIDAERSTITVHVGKTGFFSAFAHEHWVDAPIATGVLNDSGRSHVEFSVDAARMQIKPDPKVDAKTQAEVQKDMQEEVLESATYPDISFRSTLVQKLPDGQWRVAGVLALHGVSKTVTAMVSRDGAAYVSHTTIRQTDFGMKPISIAGGLVKVKDELEFDFRIVARTE